MTAPATDTTPARTAPRPAAAGRAPSAPRRNPLHDIPGPRARARNRLLGAATWLLLAAAAAYAVHRCADAGELSADAWRPFGDARLWRFIAEGLLNNLRAAAMGMLLSMIVGVLLGLALMARGRALRWPVRTVVELFRSVPLLLLLYFLSLVLPSWGLRLSDFWFLVVGLTLFNGVVIADIVRAGVLALPRGQSEAALALGFSRAATLVHVVLPQALRAMSPALVSQLVILLKGTALAFVLGGYIELLRSATIIGQYFGASVLQAYVVASLLFMAVNLGLTALAHALENRQRRRFGRAVVAADEAELEAPVGGAR
ncbi:amino acid ABC transporter permease [Streptomyces sp. RFCAC02]|uniref:amino acid ABC transporter permease n=1 Tax=Streptomyces sp. RFCAC02 TaxID=2499143 RepID=UPI0010221F64|nr:amino acid ABC transporter permease [Streptomyces sp. RFCAC02]